MAKNTKQRFVQARLKETGKEATPEQRAKFRQRFEALAATKEGRTRIAQVIAPKADAKTRAALKKSLVPQSSTGKSDTAGGTTGGSTGGTTGSTGKSFGVMGGTGGSTNKSTGGSTGSTTTSTIAPIPVVTPTTLPNNTTSTTMVKNNTSTSTTSTIPADRISPPTTVLSPPTTVFTNNASSAVIPPAQKTKTNNLPPGIFENFKLPPVAKKTPKPKDVVYGDQFAEKVALQLEKYKVPILGRVANIGRSVDAGETNKALKQLGVAVGVAGITGATAGTFQMGAKIIGGTRTSLSLLNQLRKSRSTENARTPKDYDPFPSVKEQRATNTEGLTNVRTQESRFGTVAQQRVRNAEAATSERPQFGTVAQQRAGVKGGKSPQELAAEYLAKNAKTSKRR